MTTAIARSASTASPALSLAIALLLSLPAVAVAEDRHAHREHGAHEHGVGSLNLVLDGDTLEIELESPAANLVGFEHSPENDAQRATLERTVATLKDGERLFGLTPAADCRLVASSVSSSLLGHESAATPEQDGHSAHADTDGDADHGHEAQDRETHADLDADYRFECAKPRRLARVEVRLFAVFPATQRLRVQSATDKGQRALELTPTSPGIDL